MQPLGNIFDAAHVLYKTGPKSVGAVQQEAVSEDAVHIGDQIPVVDMKDLDSPLTRGRFIAGIKEAFSSYGFVRVRNPGLNQQTIDAAYKASEDFFALPLEEKLKIRAANDGQRGFSPGEKAKGSGSVDIKEFCHIAREPNAYPNKWPADGNFKEATCALFSGLEKYAVPLQEAMAEALGLENKSIFSEMTKDGEVLLRTLHYFANPPAGTTWAAEHTDIDLFTILPRATAEGLEVEKDGVWINVGVPAKGDEDTFIINIGDMMESMSNGIFKSSKHRVVPPQGADIERYSMVLFVHPRPDDSIGPLRECIDQTGGVAKYAEATRNELLFERLIELGLLTHEETITWYAESGHTDRQIDVGRASVQVMELLETKSLASEKVLAELNRIDADGLIRAKIRREREIATQALANK